MATTFLKTPLLALLLAFFMGMSGAAIAAEEDLYENEIAEDAQISPDQIEDEHLQSFLEASEKVTEKRAEYSQRIQEADEDEVADLREEATDELAQIVEDAGLSVRQYQEIGYLLQEHEELRERLDGIAAEQADS